MLNIVLHEPEIPHNAGSAGRLALATGSRLHLIKPLGFSLDEKAVRRAGLDYWQDVDLHLWNSLEELLVAQENPRLWLLSTKGKKSPWNAEFQDNDFLIFGRETKGLPESLIAQYPEQALRIPMRPNATRSLNLATSVAIVLYEACRQINPEL